MPFRKSNIPTNTFYSTVGSEILRIGRATSDVGAFIKSTSTLLSRMSKQGAEHNPLNRVLKKMYGRHEELHKFAKNAKIFSNLLIG